MTDQATDTSVAPPVATAFRLLRALNRTAARPLVYPAATPEAAEALHRALAVLDPAMRSTVFPAWDCFPYDRTPPSRAAMGRRMGVLRWLTDPQAPPDIIVTTVPALLQRVPPRTVWADAHVDFRTGDAIDLDRAVADLERLGYVMDERVDEPGEAAVRGKVIDLFPAAAGMPCRIEHEDGRITAIRSYDPRTQRTEADAAVLLVDPASEIVSPRGADRPAEPGDAQRLPEFYPALESLFDYAPDAVILPAGDLDARGAAALARIHEAHDYLRDLRQSGRGDRLPASPERLYLTGPEWQAAAARLPAADDGDAIAAEPVPVFFRDGRPQAAFKVYVEAALAAGERVILAGAAATLPAFARRCARALGGVPDTAADWAAAKAATGPVMLALPLAAGCRLPGERLVIVAAADLLGPAIGAGAAAAVRLPGMEHGAFRIGDAVVHAEHGVGILEGLDAVSDPSGAAVDAVRLGYAGGAKRLVPVDEIGALWRYGAEAAGVTLDRLDGSSWIERRTVVEAEIAASATRLAAAMRRRKAQAAPVLKPPRAALARFAARFPYPLTPDQDAAVATVLADLASGHPMDRLVCGDVGYGKTEVALMAAAAVALSGRQVAIAAPTTVLAQQHLRTFTRRFAGFGITVAQLSRLTGTAERRKVRQGLADGSIGVVVGTHALAAKGVTFAALDLVVIDEEQRFGTQEKAKLRALAADGHTLRLTATPIPRTLQASLVGLQDLSLITTPPVARQPIRTVLAPFDAGMVRVSLMREKRRGGQSFVVCPRIEDIAPMTQRLRDIVPELALVVAHGKMPAAEIDAAMVGFADGVGDVLLATNIIESGLDVPAANTMLVWRPDRFGLAQLHQLRGRVGRGAQRGFACLLTEPEKTLPAATEKRLRTLEALSHLGAGFEISARDLDLRGAGDLFGEEQAGHMKLIGTDLYQHLLQRALAGGGEDAAPAINLGVRGRLPPDYVPEPEVRLNLYARLDRLADDAAIAAFEDELDDRFGDIPEPVVTLLTLARLRAACRARGIRELDGGPDALAVTFRDGAADAVVPKGDGPLAWSGERLIYAVASKAADRLSAATAFLDAIVPDRPAERDAPGRHGRSPDGAG